MIVIEGLIGAGKTTLSGKILEEIPNSKQYLEPVGENPYLERFYKDQARWGLEMQFYLMAHRFRMHQQAIEHEWNTGQQTIFDRSIYGDAAFAHMLYKSGAIDKLGYNSYMNHRRCMEKFLLPPQIVIWLDVSVQTCLDRISQRGRDCEKGIPREYLEGLLESYMEVVIEPLKKITEVQCVDWEEFDMLKINVPQVRLRSMQ